MRLTETQRTEIVILAKRYFGQHAVVRLFGSRTKDGEIGGDIDLHIQPENGFATLANELEFTADLKDRIDEQKIDVIVRAPGHIPRGIDKIAMRSGMVL